MVKIRNVKDNIPRDDSHDMREIWLLNVKGVNKMNANKVMRGLKGISAGKS